MVADNITLQCDWLLTPGGIYDGKSVIVPLSTHKLSEVVALMNFTFQIAPVDGELLRWVIIRIETNTNLSEL